MASPTIETFCCVASSSEPSIVMRLQFHYTPYNIVCVLSSLLGILGAVYQIFPSPASNIPHRHRSIGHTQKAIINWLAMADFFAASGILLRSIFWLWRGDFVEDDGTDLIICAIFAVWVRYFYTATYMWTICYAIDVFLVCKQKVGSQKCYHAFSWFIALLLTTTGLGTLYLPNFRCHTGPLRVFPNYLLSYIPILLIMIMNPILYYISSKNVRILLTGGLGQLTYLEHNLLAALKEKFFCIVLVFYICWLPNIVNGILLWGIWENLPRNILVGVWYVMAIMNPLQAVFNSLVYKGWKGCSFSWVELKAYFCCCKEQPRSGLLIERSSSDQQFTPERPTLSTNNFQD